jgi:pyridoxine 5-phosphate synthase
MPPVLSVNLNKVALLRNARLHGVPNVVKAAEAVLAAGAGGLTVHPRPDQRHIRPDDVRALAKVARRARVELNVEGNPFEGPREDGFPGYMALVEEVRPAQATLVPDAEGQLTSDHGFDPTVDTARLEPVVRRLKALGCRVSLFADANPATVEGFSATGADRVEIYTGPFAEAVWSGKGIDQALDHCRLTARRAREVGLGVNAGHDLDLENLPLLARALKPNLQEVSIGHALTADALWLGWTETIARYRAALAG